MRPAEDFGKLSGGDYGVRRFAGQALRLPHRPEWWPGRENLRAQAGAITYRRRVPGKYL